MKKIAFNESKGATGYMNHVCSAHGVQRKELSLR